MDERSWFFWRRHLGLPLIAPPARHFNDQPLDEAALRARLDLLETGVVLQRAPETLVSAIPLSGGELQLAFFGGIRFGRVGEPEVAPNRIEIAAPIDLLATKPKVLLQRIEAKDYLDVEALLKGGIALSDGIAAAWALFSTQLNPI